jgi:ABC-type dipeptide/oligopeptide/nickel transport system permease subunit
MSVRHKEIKKLEKDFKKVDRKLHHSLIGFGTAAIIIVIVATSANFYRPDSGAQAVNNYNVTPITTAQQYENKLSTDGYGKVILISLWILGIIAVALGLYVWEKNRKIRKPDIKVPINPPVDHLEIYLRLQTW